MGKGSSKVQDFAKHRKSRLGGTKVRAANATHAKVKVARVRLPHQRTLVLAEASEIMLPSSGEIAPSTSVTEGLHVLLNKSGYYDALRMSKDPQDEARVENLDELVAVTREFARNNPDGTLLDFLTEVTLVSDADDLDDASGSVSLMTMHTAKGLEFDAGFVTGVEEDLIPHRISAGEPGGPQEERRLFYVALTRARKRLHLSLAMTRAQFGEVSVAMPSRFLQEIPAHLIDWRQSPGDVNGRGGTQPAPCPPRGPRVRFGHTEGGWHGPGREANVQPPRRACGVHRRAGGLRRLRLGERGRARGPSGAPRARRGRGALAARRGRARGRRDAGRPRSGAGGWGRVRPAARPARPGPRRPAMKPRAVVLAPEAVDDLHGLYDWVAGMASPVVAMGYLERVERFLAGLSVGSERGHLRSDVRPGLRIVGFERRLTVAFLVDDDRLTVLRVLRAGQDWESSV
jgi:plasmid stabilization system protein ParE